VLTKVITCRPGRRAASTIVRTFEPSVKQISSALLLAADGRRVIVLERDPAPPPAEPVDAWSAWSVRG